MAFNDCRYIVLQNILQFFKKKIITYIFNMLQYTLLLTKTFFSENIRLR